MSFGYCICSPVDGPNHGYVRARSIRLDQGVLTRVEGSNRLTCCLDVILGYGCGCGCGVPMELSPLADRSDEGVHLQPTDR
eukprot:scaffold148748_cov87-Attheya_sp.AAC.1